MRLQIILAIVCLAVSLVASAPQAGKSDQDAIQGTWRLIGGEVDGKVLTKEKMQEMRKGAAEMEMTFKGDVASPNNGGPPVNFKLDPAKKPKHIDFAIEVEKKVVKGIYELAGDELKLRFNPDGNDRPTEFKTKEGSKGGMLVFKRVKQ